MLFTHSSASGHLGCLQPLAVVNSAAVNMGVHVGVNMGVNTGVHMSLVPALSSLGVSLVADWLSFSLIAYSRSVITALCVVPLRAGASHHRLLGLSTRPH